MAFYFVLGSKILAFTFREISTVFYGNEKKKIRGELAFPQQRLN